MAPFDGDTYERAQDLKRLSSQLDRAREVMRSGRWYTLAHLAGLTGGSEASVSARLRDLRKAKFGAWTVERRRVEGGLYEYRLQQPAGSPQLDLLPRAQP